MAAKMDGFDDYHNKGLNISLDWQLQKAAGGVKPAPIIKKFLYNNKSHHCFDYQSCGL